jgi:hypothetical protein
LGIIKRAKSGTAAAHAEVAAEEGGSVLLYRFNIPATSSGWSGPIAGAAEVIEAIEEYGWQLDNFAFDRAQSSNGGVLLLFRRPQQAAAPIPPPQSQQMQPPYPPRRPPRYEPPQDGYDDMYRR